MVDPERPRQASRPLTPRQDRFEAAIERALSRVKAHLRVD
jgi:hypothetical protein